MLKVYVWLGFVVAVGILLCFNCSSAVRGSQEVAACNEAPATSLPGHRQCCYVHDCLLILRNLSKKGRSVLYFNLGFLTLCLEPKPKGDTFYPKDPFVLFCFQWTPNRFTQRFARGTRGAGCTQGVGYGPSQLRLSATVSRWSQRECQSRSGSKKC